MKIKNKDNSEHYFWGNLCDGWHLLDTSSLSIIQERMPAGTEESHHYHSSSQQFFYILKGTAEFEVDNLKYVVEANNGFHIKPLEIHKIANISEVDLEFLVISEPKSHGDRINV
ncbi:MAG: cupin domain-containing protein [Chryseobacterium sp.]|nr:cupin domain-containing protein [Candidatus Chryseobacterium enterohippi]